ncbi:MAG: ABC transporter permease subunit [Methylobacteriaceae bacterium]|nr:ABC transporter permease subunit [Methylobacteriaceae bacterium]
MSAPSDRSLARRLALAVPTLWMAALFLTPFALVAKVSLSTPALSQPPYAPVFALAEGAAAALDKFGELGVAAYRALLDDDLYLASYLGSLRLAAIATALTLLVAYPLALAIARAPRRRRAGLLMLAIAPFWTSFLIRVYAWIMLIKDEGLINHALMASGLVAEPLRIFATDAAVVIGVVYSYLPFMVMPLYAALEGQDAALREAAADLGAPPLRVFWRVTAPLSLPGVLAGSLLVFIPAVGEFVIPDLLGGSDTLMIGRTLWAEFFSNRDWPAAAAVAIVMLAMLAPMLVLYERLQMREAGR